MTGEYLKKSLSELPDVTVTPGANGAAMDRQTDQLTEFCSKKQSLTITPVPPVKHNLPSAVADGMLSFSTENEMNLPNIASKSPVEEQKATSHSGLENVYTSEGQIVTRPEVSIDTTRVVETNQKALPVQKLEVVYTPQRQMLIRGLLPGQKVMLLPDGNLQVLPAAQ